MNTLVINPGSSNVKFSLYENNSVYLKGKIELDGRTDIKNKSVNNAGKLILARIKKFGKQKIDKIAYRVVYSGKYKEHCMINSEVLNNLRKTVELDPNHMPQTIKLIEFFMKKTKAKHIACFDTVFYNSMPESSKIYAIPSGLTKKYGIKRYGFHGLAHQEMSRKAKASKVITCQLGNGVSVSAVKNGKCIDTSMGFTPLEGLMMGTRSGNIDPALIEFLCKKEKKTVSEITKILQKESGLKGIAGESDMRILLKRKNRKSRLAVDMFCYAVKKQIGAYIAALNGVDCVVLGGGISHNPEIVKKIMDEINSRYIVYDADEQEEMLEISKDFKG